MEREKQEPEPIEIIEFITLVSNWFCVTVQADDLNFERLDIDLCRHSLFVLVNFTAIYFRLVTSISRTIQKLALLLCSKAYKLPIPGLHYKPDTKGDPLGRKHGNKTPYFSQIQRQFGKKIHPR